MKRSFLVIFVVACMLVFNSLAWASHNINVTNSCDKNVTIYGLGNTNVIGVGNMVVDTIETIDCRVSVNAGATGTCYMPMCINNISGIYTSGGTSHDLNKIHCTHSSASQPCCNKDIHVEVTNGPSDTCKLRLR